MADTFPKPLLALAAPEILRVINDPNIKPHMPKAVDWQAMKSKAEEAMSTGRAMDGERGSAQLHRFEY